MSSLPCAPHADAASLATAAVTRDSTRNTGRTGAAKQDAVSGHLGLKPSVGDILRCSRDAPSGLKLSARAVERWWIGLEGRSDELSHFGSRERNEPMLTASSLTSHQTHIPVVPGVPPNMLELHPAVECPDL